MRLSPIVRIFFAIDLPLSTKEELGSFIGMLKRKSKSHAIRWSKPDNLHVTLQFLPEVKREDLPTLIDRVREEIKAANKLSFMLEALHLFPSPYRPRVIVFSITPQHDLAHLSQLIGQGIQTLYPLEKRSFRAHLTLGRIKYTQGLDLHFLSECKVPAMLPIEVNETVLFQSEPQPEGSKYIVLERIEFEGL